MHTLPRAVPAISGVGEPKIGIRVDDDVVGAVEMPTTVIIQNRNIRAVCDVQAVDSTNRVAVGEYIDFSIVIRSAIYIPQRWVGGYIPHLLA